MVPVNGVNKCCSVKSVQKMFIRTKRQLEIEFILAGLQRIIPQPQINLAEWLLK